MSVEGATYFLTLCLKNHATCLAHPSARSAVLAELKRMEADSSWTVRCAMVMPDHLHLVVVLGERLSLAQVVGRLKAKTRPVLNGLGGSWQTNFFDHRVDPDEDLISLFCYLFKNPYRAGLAGGGERWDGWYCRPSDMAWFGEYLDEDRPPPQWLDTR